MKKLLSLMLPVGILLIMLDAQQPVKGQTVECSGTYDGENYQGYRFYDLCINDFLNGTYFQGGSWMARADPNYIEYCRLALELGSDGDWNGAIINANKALSLTDSSDPAKFILQAANHAKQVAKSQRKVTVNGRIVSAYQLWFMLTGTRSSGD